MMNPRFLSRGLARVLIQKNQYIGKVTTTYAEILQNFSEFCEGRVFPNEHCHYGATLVEVLPGAEFIIVDETDDRGIQVYWLAVSKVTSRFGEPYIYDSEGDKHSFPSLGFIADYTTGNWVRRVPFAASVQGLTKCISYLGSIDDKNASARAAKSEVTDFLEQEFQCLVTEDDEGFIVVGRGADI